MTNEIRTVLALRRLENEVPSAALRVVDRAREVGSNHGRCALLAGIALHAQLAPADLARLHAAEEPAGLYFAWRGPGGVWVQPAGLNAIPVGDPPVVSVFGPDLGPILIRLLGIPAGEGSILVVLHVTQHGTPLDPRCL